MTRSKADDLEIAELKHRLEEAESELCRTRIELALVKGHLEDTKAVAALRASRLTEVIQALETANSNIAGFRLDAQSTHDPLDESA